jgi:hypothetical protein
MKLNLPGINVNTPWQRSPRVFSTVFFGVLLVALWTVIGWGIQRSYPTLTLPSNTPVAKPHGIRLSAQAPKVVCI